MHTSLRFFLASIILFNLSVNHSIADSLTTAPSENNIEKFNNLLIESGLSYQEIDGFKDVDIEPEYVMPYEKRIRTKDESLEVRYAIRPLKRIEIVYDDPHSSAPHPNDLFEMLFRTLTETLAGGSHVISRAYPPDQAKKLFNAGWASAGAFDISPDISKQYKQAMMITIHHNDKADAYILILTDDLGLQKQTISKLKGSLKFTQFEKGINQPEPQ